MPVPPVRTITLGIAEPHPLSPVTIQQAAVILRQASARFSEAGYEVQTVRLSTRPIFDDLANRSPAAMIDYAKELQRMLDDAGLAFCSLGTAQTTRPDFPLERLELIADLLIPTSALNATVQIANVGAESGGVGSGLRTQAALPTARIMQRLARETAEGFGNFRFAMLARAEPGCPFFPTAYHSGPASLSIGLQGAGIVTEALQRGEQSPLELTFRVKDALVKYATPIVTLGQGLAREQQLIFGGIDLSPAPLGEDSIITAIEQVGFGRFGSPGTLAVVTALTAALKSTGLPTCGYCGLMLPVLEDAVLGQRWEDGAVNVHQLLLYSAICGTGLDTIPLPGDCPVESIAQLLLDVATLALRLQKSLSARLFPVPGKQAGERTTFTSPYLTNTLVLSL